jgi:RimJ/RimL family protein N-acetyltransferase
MPIRRLLPLDATAYRALMLEAYAAHPDAFTSTVGERASLPLPWWQARLADEAAAPNVVLGTFEEGRLAGVAGIEFESRTKTRHKTTLFGMYVPVASRGKGIGADLVHAALAAARERPEVRLMQLTVSQGNRAAERLYEKCGFSAFGIEPFAIAVEGGYVAKVHMWRALFPQANG